jgi:hypothetical protein
MIRNTLILTTALLAIGGCANDPEPTTIEGLTFDPCQPLLVAPAATTTPDEVQAVSDSIALWNNLAGTKLAIAPGDGSDAGASTVTLVYQGAAGAFHGFYDPTVGQVYVNTDLSGHPREVTIAHEIGHAMGLVHVSTDVRQSVMNPGNLTNEPLPSDVDALTTLWGHSCTSN